MRMKRRRMKMAAKLGRVLNTCKIEGERERERESKPRRWKEAVVNESTSGLVFGSCDWRKKGERDFTTDESHANRSNKWPRTKGHGGRAEEGRERDINQEPMNSGSWKCMRTISGSEG
jgi:hypothetical protein